MASPIRPSDIKDTLPTTDGSACVRLKKILIDFPRRVYEWFSYIYNEDGTFTEKFKTDFCEIDCDNVGEETTGPIPPGGNDPGGNLQTPTVFAGAGMNPSGGIPIVWNSIEGAVKYDLYRGTTNSTTATTTVRIRKDLIATGGGYIPSDDNRLLKRNNELIYYDRNHGKLYKPGVGDQNNNSLSGQVPYYYWVVAKNNSGARSDMSSPSIGFSRYATNFTAIGTPELQWTGATKAVTTHGSASQTMDAMRVVLRGGGGGGGGGGDYMLPTYVKFHVTAVTYANSGGGDNSIILTLHQSNVAANFSSNEIITFENAGTGSSSWNKDDFEVDYFDGQTLKLKPVSGLGTLNQNGTVPGDTSKAYFGSVFANNKKLPTRVAGGGGGAGGILQVVFDINTSGASKITHVKVQTEHGSTASGNPTVVNYDVNSSTGYSRTAVTNPSRPGEASYHYPYNEGGKGRTSDASADGPKMGEPRAGSEDNNTTNTGPYRTCLYISSDGSNYDLVAWVGDGEGGGYSNGKTLISSVGGKGSSEHYWNATTGKFHTSASEGGNAYVLARYGTKNVTNVCTVRTNALGGNVNGARFFIGTDGADGRGAAGSLISGGTPGKGGYAWDSFPSSNGRSAQSKEHVFYSGGSGSFAYDLVRPGSGGFGAYGSVDASKAEWAWGGHALAGSSYITFKLATASDYDAA